MIRNHVIDFFFLNLLFKQVSWWPKLDGIGIGFEPIEQQITFRLGRSFKETEVPVVMRKMAKDKVLGPGGFFVGFFQFCWDVVNEDLIKVFEELFLVGRFEKSLNVTFIGLIPKKIRTSKVKDY